MVAADVRNLQPVTEGGFDAALLMGPLYHLVREADRKLALQNVFARLKPGGVIVIEVGSGRTAVETAFPELSPTWLETSAGGDQVFLLERDQLPA